MKIILKKGAKYKVVYARTNGQLTSNVTSGGITERDISFNHTELTQREWNNRVARRYTYKYPFPTLAGREIEAIEWIAGNDNELVL